MLESNTLDMKDSIRGMEQHQRDFSSQLNGLIAVHSAAEKSKEISRLEKSQSDLEARLSRLEGRLEILIDGFTALAQELNKMKRTRHISSSHKAPPSLSTVIAVPLYSTPQPQVSNGPTKRPLSDRATVPKSIPTPGLPAKKPTDHHQRDGKPAATVQNSTRTQDTRSQGKRSRGQVSDSAAKVKASVTASRKPLSTVKPKAAEKPESTVANVSQPGQTRPRHRKEETTMTVFQLVPPSHNSKPAETPQLQTLPDQGNKKDSSPAMKGNRANNNNPFRADAPAAKKVQVGGKSSVGDAKKLRKPHTMNPSRNGQKPTKLTPSSNKTRSTANTVTTTKVATAKRKSNTVKKKTLNLNSRRAPTVQKKSYTTAQRTLKQHNKKASAAKKVGRKSQQKTNSHSGILDLLRLLKGDHKTARSQKIHDGSLHVVLGRLAIPIRIIPDD